MKIYEDLLVLINEVSDELAQRVKEKRRDNWSKAFRLKGLVNSDTYQNEIDWNRKNGRPDKAEEMEKAREKANAEATEATQKSQRNDYLMDQRRERKAKERKKLEEFKEKLLNKKQTPQETQKAGSDHANAIIDQGLRNKLEKVFSHECLEEICALVEEFINELEDETVENAWKKRRENYNRTWDEYMKAKEGGNPEEINAAHKADYIAAMKLDRNERLRRSRNNRKDENRRDVERFRQKLLNKDPQTTKEYKRAAQDHDNAIIDQGLRAKLEKCLKVSESCMDDIMALIEAQCCPSYVDKDGATQFQLFNTGLTGRNLQQENKPQPKVAKVKNPNRVEGGKRGRQTRVENIKKEFANRSIFKALGYDPFNNGGENG